MEYLSNERFNQLVQDGEVEVEYTVSERVYQVRNTTTNRRYTVSVEN